MPELQNLFHKCFILVHEVLPIDFHVPRGSMFYLLSPANKCLKKAPHTLCYYFTFKTLFEQELYNYQTQISRHHF
jgi:hypothetical protein